MVLRKIYGPKRKHNPEGDLNRPDDAWPTQTQLPLTHPPLSTGFDKTKFDSVIREKRDEATFFVSLWRKCFTHYWRNAFFSCHLLLEIDSNFLYFLTKLEFSFFFRSQSRRGCFRC